MWIDRFVLFTIWVTKTPISLRAFLNCTPQQNPSHLISAVRTSRSGGKCIAFCASWLSNKSQGKSEKPLVGANNIIWRAQISSHCLYASTRMRLPTVRRIISHLSKNQTTCLSITRLQMIMTCVQMPLTGVSGTASLWWGRWKGHKWTRFFLPLFQLT